MHKCDSDNKFPSFTKSLSEFEGEFSFSLSFSLVSCPSNFSMRSKYGPQLIIGYMLLFFRRPKRPLAFCPLSFADGPLLYSLSPSPSILFDFLSLTLSYCTLCENIVLFFLFRSNFFLFLLSENLFRFVFRAFSISFSLTSQLMNPDKRTGSKWRGCMTLVSPSSIYSSFNSLSYHFYLSLFSLSFPSFTLLTLFISPFLFNSLLSLSFSLQDMRQSSLTRFATRNVWKSYIC